jgi:hypothetical protein
MRRAVAFCLALFPFAAAAQGDAPQFPAPPPLPGSATPVQPFGPASQGSAQGAGQAAGFGPQGYGGCYGCSYSGDYYGSNAAARRPAPPLRLQGQWRNGWWYY